MKEQILLADTFSQTIDIIDSDPNITSEQREVLKFIKFYKQSIEKITNGDFTKLEKYYILTPIDRLSNITDFLFESGKRDIFLNFIKIKILYLEKAEVKTKEIDVQGDYEYYENRSKGEIIEGNEEILREEIRDYLY